MAKILPIKQIKNKTWIQTTDNKWHNISIMDNEEMYVEGRFILENINNIRFSGENKKCMKDYIKENEELKSRVMDLQEEINFRIKEDNRFNNLDL